ncbi:MAG: hypothetical protein IJK04_10735, partial [Kiritimatiellae bacterium]|nr:hypothetical protein [Kiritimatiellia bacterium]
MQEQAGVQSPKAARSENAPSLPPPSATLEELQSARSGMADALDARRAEGWPDSSEASAALAAGIATLDGRIS